MRLPALILAGVTAAAAIAAVAIGAPVSRRAEGTVYVNCWHQASGSRFSGYFVARERPRTCTIWGLPEDLANENVLRHLRWRAWGQAVTTLKGQVRNTQPGMGRPLWTAVTAVLSRVRQGCHDDRFYTWITFPGSDATPERLSDSCEPPALAGPATAFGPRPRVVTQLWGLEARPYVIGFTGDGTGFLGGFTGRKAFKPPTYCGDHADYGTLCLRKLLGRLHWTTWTSQQGIAHGAVWGKTCNPDCADGTFENPTATTVHVYRPGFLHGQDVFTRLSYTYGRRTVMLALVYNYGSEWTSA